MLPSNRKYMCEPFGVVTMRHGYGAMRGTPAGRQCASGSSFAMRDSFVFLPSAVYGMVSPAARPSSMSLVGPPPIQTPCRSGWPSDARGVGPETAGRAPRPAGAGVWSAESGSDTAARTTAAANAFSNFVMLIGTPELPAARALLAETVSSVRDGQRSIRSRRHVDPMRGP